MYFDALGSSAGGGHTDAVAPVGLVPHSSRCGTVETLPFTGFFAPIDNEPGVNPTQSGSDIPVKSSVGQRATFTDVIAAGYPQSTSVPCAAAAGTATTGDPTSSASAPVGSDGSFTYTWKTDAGYTGCRELIVKLIDVLTGRA